MSIDFYTKDMSNHNLLSDKAYYSEIYSISTADESSLNQGDIVAIKCCCSGSYKVCIVASNDTTNGLQLVEYTPHSYVRSSKEITYSYLDKSLYLGPDEISCIYKTDDQTFQAQGVDSLFKSYTDLHNE